MNRVQKRFTTVVLFAAAAALSRPAASDPADDCAARHGGDSDAHIACLVAALRAGEGGTVEAPPPRATAGLGTEQIRQAQPDKGKADREVPVRIVQASYDRAGIGTYRTEDGQVWKETMPSPAHRRLAADKPYTGRIVRGLLGGYRLHVDGIRHMKTVKRIA